MKGSLISGVGLSKTATLLEAGITIRPYRVEDAPALYEAAIASVEEIRPFMPWCHEGLTVEQARAWIEDHVTAFESRMAFEFVIMAADGSVLGSCGVNQIDEVKHRGNLGYWVRTSATGRGVATAAIQQVVRWVFENTNLDKLEVVVSTRNAASIRAAEKAGATREGVSQGRLWLHGTAHDAVIFSFVRAGEPID